MSTVLGLQPDHSADKLIKSHQVIKYIEEDFMNFGGSMNMLLNSIMPDRFKRKVLRKDVSDFFYDYVSREITRRKSNSGTSKIDVLQTFIDAAAKNSMSDEFITSQIFTFFAGG